MWKNILCHGHDKLQMHMHLEIETFVSTKSLMVQITIILVLKFATQHLHFSPSKCEVFQVTCDIQLIKSLNCLHGIVLSTESHQILFGFITN